MNQKKISAVRNCVRVVNVLTSSLSVRFLEGQPAWLETYGFEVIVVSSPGDELTKAKRSGVQTIEAPIARPISPLKDLISFLRLLRVIRGLRPSITNVGTPKAGLLGGIAAWMSRVPCRYYTLHGLRCETATGLKRRLLLLTEHISCLCAHRVICVSESLRRKAVELGIVGLDRTMVLGSGACTGVDPVQFAPTADLLHRAQQVRRTLFIAQEAPVIGFVGRLTKDKGISELVEAYMTLRPQFLGLKLLLVGDMEDGDPLPIKTRQRIQSDAGVIHTGFVQDPIPYYHAMDVFALPTYREGLPCAILEAHAAGKPVVAARATGVVDSVIDGVTGILVPVGDPKALSEALKLILTDRKRAAALATAGRERVVRDFRREIIWDALAQEYLQLLDAKGFSDTRVAPEVLSAQRSNTSVLSL